MFRYYHRYYHRVKGWKTISQANVPKKQAGVITEKGASVEEMPP
jgi:hypothetical protein